MRFVVLLLIVVTGSILAQDSPALRQTYNGKFGYYRPDPSISNGLAIGVDGMTEFVNYDVFASIGADLYLKQSFNPFIGPAPNIEQQSLIVIPITISAGYMLADAPDADSRVYAGVGAGYTLTFYSLSYSSSSGGLFGGSLTSNSHSKSSGMFTMSAQLRLVVGKIFLEPKLYFASESRTTIDGNYTYSIDPSGFILTLGYSAK